MFGGATPLKSSRKETSEGLSTLRNLINWQREISNVYDLTTWPNMFKRLATQNLLIQCGTTEVEVQNSIIQGDTPEAKAKRDKGRWEQLYYVTWRRRVLVHVHPRIMSESIARIDMEWRRFKSMFRVASIRQLLSNKMAVCTNYWLANIIEPIGGANPRRTVREDNTVLTVQNSEQPVVGWPHESEKKYPRLLLTVVMDQPATEGTVYKCEVEMVGIRRGEISVASSTHLLTSAVQPVLHDLGQGEGERAQGGKSKFEWLHVSIRSQRAMRAIFDLLKQEYKVDEMTRKSNDQSNDQMVVIRHEPLRLQWEKVNYITYFKKGSSLNDGQRIILRWHILIYRCVSRQVISNPTVSNLSRRLGYIMVYYHCQRTQSQYKYRPAVLPTPQERWQSIYRKAKYPGHATTSWTQQLIRYPWYRWIPLLSRLSSLKMGVRYLPTDSCTEDAGGWRNPEAVTDQRWDIASNDLLWKSWGDECKESLRAREIAFYTNKEIEDWWTSLEVTHKREALKWMLYDRLDYRWHCATGLWTYYLGKVPGRIQPIPPYTILHSRERRVHQSSEKWDRLETTEPTDEIQHGTVVISDQRWKYYSQVKALLVRHGNRLYNPPTKKPLGGNSIVPDAWSSTSKEEALHFQRQHCERLAHHQMGIQKNGQPSRAINFHIYSLNMQNHIVTDKLPWSKVLTVALQSNCLNE